jgi:homogentisate 1,2-dioxygenase
MLERVQLGQVPPKPHTALRGPSGQLHHEECLTRNGFDGAFTILYHERPPHALERRPAVHTEGFAFKREGASGPSSNQQELALTRRHFRTTRLDTPAADARVRLLYNDDVTLSVARAAGSDTVYRVNADGDELYFVRAGRGTVRSVFGDLSFGAGDYLCVPKGTLHRLVIEDALDSLVVEWRGGMGIPRQYRNESGQLRMDAPYSHRDFRKPVFVGPTEEGIRDIHVKRGGVLHAFAAKGTPLDVVGWDGAVYPFVFPILAFQPRVGAVHLPPTVHGTFAGRGALLCSFVPRPLDFHPDAVPCPYPHSSVDVDEVLYYVSGNFGSRRGVEPGSITLHPAGIPHGPHPGRYEESIGQKRTEEVAVMLDCHKPLAVALEAEAIEDTAYDESFGG